MTIVTFMSDFGKEDHYVAAVKAAILKINPNVGIIDISHEIYPSDIGHASYVLKSVFKDFPEGTIHLCAIDIANREPSRLVAIKLEEHYFVGSDCGIFSLLSDQQPTMAIELNNDQPEYSTFEAKDILAPVVGKLANGSDLKDFGKDAGQLKTLYARQLKVTKREIAGNIIRVDHYGNLITNIKKSEFDIITKINGNKPFQVCFGRERCSRFHKSFFEVDSGEYFIIFNSNGLLQIGINKGNASELLGLNLDAPVTINFET